jgi:hypothetical protein
MLTRKKGPISEPVQLDELDKKMTWTWLLYTKVQRVEV